VHAREAVPQGEVRHERFASRSVNGTLMKTPASTNSRMATYCAAIHHGPEMSSGMTGFQTTAIASITGSHHQCFAWKANTSTTSARIDTMNRKIRNASDSMSAIPPSIATAASSPGANAVRRKAGRP
jgi:hypothetical protein